MTEKRLIIEDTLEKPYECPYRAMYTLEGSNRFAPFSLYICTHPNKLIRNDVTINEKLLACAQEGQYEFPKGCPLTSVIKTLKFTDENWKLHMNHSKTIVTTARDERKCAIGDYMIFPDGNTWKCFEVDKMCLDEYCRTFSEEEGFGDDWNALRDTLLKCYPHKELKEVYWHRFVLDEGDVK